jgi:uncharacterized protein (TIGR02145 family)
MNSIKILVPLVFFAISFTACDKSSDDDNNNASETACTNSFSSLGTLVDSRDGIEYKTVTIGTQNWMAENLRYDATDSYLNPDNPCVGYGRLYDWHSIMDGASSSSANPSGVQGLCPSGWHVPSDDEWNQMEIALGMDAADASVIGFRGTHGNAMKSQSDWNSNGNGTNANGFNAFPTGYAGLGTATSLYGFNLETYFMTATEFSADKAWDRNFDYGKDGILRSYDIDKVALMACRCVED